jgi:hypothetical protein
VAGPAIAALGFCLLAVPATGGSYWYTFFPAVLVLGLGMAISVAPLTTTVMNALDAGQAGAASGVNNAVSRLAALLAVALFGVVMSSAFSHALAALAGEVSPAVMQQVLAQQDRLAAAAVPPQASAAEAVLVRNAIGAAFVHGFRWVMLIAAALALASAYSAWRLIDDGRPRQSGPA